MLEFFASLFDTSSFPPRWYCGQWSAGHGYLHIFSDIGIWGAYTAIPLVLAYFVMRRRDVPFPKIFWLFVAFIYACGTTHLLEALMFWWPGYRVLGTMKFITAVVSWATVFALIQAMPVAMRFPKLAQVNAELEQANQDLTEFASIVGHDLRAPLRGAKSIVQWIEEDDPNLSATTRDHLTLLNQQVNKMDELLEGILRYARIGRVKVTYHPVDAHELAQQAIAALNPPKGITVEIPRRLPEISFDETLLHQIFQNLVGNAIKHMGRDTGHIAIEWEERSQYWEFTVRDDGPGIAEKDHDRIFKIFQSLNPKEEEISGLGLALVKKILDQIGGQIRLKSTLGAGSAFVFTIPRDLEERQRARMHFSEIAASETA